MLRSNCFKSQANSIYSTCCSRLYSMLGPTYTVFSLSIDVSFSSLSDILQTATVGQYVLLSPHGNKKLKALLQGTFLHRIFFFASVDDFVNLALGFFDEKGVYLRFSHILNFQPKFHIGSTSSSVLNREHTRFRKFLQVNANLFLLKWPCDFGTSTTISGCGQLSRCTRVNPTFGLWNKP